MTNPGNTKIREQKPWEKSTGPKTEEGKFKCSLNNYKGKDSNPWRQSKIPKTVIELYTWYKFLPTEERKFLFEMKGIYDVLKANLQNNEDLTNKITEGKKLSMQEISQFQLLINTLEKLQKLHYGEKRINIEISAKDLIGSLHDNR